MPVGLLRRCPESGSRPGGAVSLPPPAIACALRLPCADHVAHHLLRAVGLQRLVQRHTLREWREAWPAKCTGRAVVLETVSVVAHLSLIALRSRPSPLSRSRTAGLDRSLRSLHQLAPAGQRSGINGLRPPAVPDFIPFAGLPRLSLLVAPARNPARALRGAPCAALFEAAPKGRTIKVRRTDMTTKTTNTTNDAGFPPAPPEAHQRAGGKIGIEDLKALREMLKNPAPTIRRAAAEMLAQLRAGGVELAF